MSRLLIHEGHQYAEDRLPDGVDGATLPTSKEWFAAAKATAVEPVEASGTEAEPAESAEPAGNPASAGPVEPVEVVATEAQPADVKARRSK